VTPPRSPRTSSASGFSLLELLLVLAVLAVVLVVVLPNFTAMDGNRLDVAAAEVADALRYARTEAMRRGSQNNLTLTRMIAFDASTSTHHIRVSDYSGYKRVAAWPNPVDHAAYDVDLYNGALTQGVTISAVTISNSNGTSAGSVVGFTQDGAPIQFAGVFGVGLSWPITSCLVQLSYAGHSRQISMDPTGRVVVGPLL